jgi:uncharacterized protein (DUF697 family)
MTDKEIHAQDIVSNYVWWSAGAGLLPFPVLDLAAVTGVQLRMLSRLSKLYGYEFSENLGKSLIGSLLGSVVPANLARGVVGSLIKAVPVVGPLAGLVTQPAFSGAATYAIGMVFIRHFEEGGTLLDFDPVKRRAYFEQKYNEHKKHSPSPTSSSVGSTTTPSV